MKVIVRNAGGPGPYEIVYGGRGRLKGKVVATAERLQMSEVQFQEGGQVRGLIDASWGIEGEGLTLFRRHLGISKVWKAIPGLRVSYEETRGWITQEKDPDTWPFFYVMRKADRLQLTGDGPALAIGII